MSNENLISESKEVAKYIPESAAARVYRLIEALNEAERKLESVVAENACAKKIIGECREFFIAGVMNRIRPTNEGYLHMICDTFADETPATDAFLAEVRASELDSLAGVAETMLVKFANQNASQIPEAKGWEMIQRQTSHRAAQLRQESK